MANPVIYNGRLTSGQVRGDGKPDANLFTTNIRRDGVDAETLTDILDAFDERIIQKYDSLPPASGFDDGTLIRVKERLYEKGTNPHDHALTGVSGSHPFRDTTFTGTAVRTIYFPNTGEWTSTPHDSTLVFGIQTASDHKNVIFVLPHTDYARVVSGSLTVGTAPLIVEVTDGTTTAILELLLASTYSEYNVDLLRFNLRVDGTNAELTKLETLLAAGNAYRVTPHGASLNNDGTIPAGREIYDYAGATWREIGSGTLSDNQVVKLTQSNEELQAEVNANKILIQQLTAIVDNIDQNAHPTTSLTANSGISFTPAVVPITFDAEDFGPGHTEALTLPVEQDHILFHLQNLRSDAGRETPVTLTAEASIQLRKPNPTAGRIGNVTGSLIFRVPDGTETILGEMFNQNLTQAQFDQARVNANSVNDYGDPDTPINLNITIRHTFAASPKLAENSELVFRVFCSNFVGYASLRVSFENVILTVAAIT